MKKLLLIIFCLPLAVFAQGKTGTVKVKKPKPKPALDTLKSDSPLYKGDNTIIACAVIIPGLPNGSEVELKKILEATGLVYWDTALCKVPIIQYDVVIKHGEKQRRQTNRGQLFTKETKEFLLLLQPGDELTFVGVLFAKKNGPANSAIGATYKIKE